MAKADPTVAESSRNDANQQFTIIGVQGTLGTADIAGTARTMTFGGNPVTGAMYVQDLSGAVGTTNIQGSVTIIGGTIQAGTFTNLGTNVNVVTGTILNSGAGTITTGTIQNISTGTINALAAGTITGGTLQNLVSGTINALASGTLTGGTLQNLNNGTLALVTNLAAGTLRIDPTPVASIVQQGTLGTAGGSFFGTLSAVSGAGTKHYVSGIDIVMQSGTADVRVLAGSVIQGTGVLAAGFFGPSSGISKHWWPHFQTGTNSELIYHFVGAGTAFINISYWKGV